MKEYIIDPVTRKINPVNKDAALGVFSDNLMDGATFIMQGSIVPKLSTFNARVNYLNHNEERVEFTPLANVRISGDTLTGTWILDKYATDNTGQILFSVCFVQEDGKEWNTTIFKDTILEGLEASPRNEPTEGEKETFESLYEEAVRRFNIAADEKKTEVLNSIKLNTAGLVKSVNGVKPDSTGNVTIETGSGEGIPPTGIGYDNLTSSVQASLDKADSALQAIPSGYLKTTDADIVYMKIADFKRIEATLEDIRKLVQNNIPSEPESIVAVLDQAILDVSTLG